MAPATTARVTTPRNVRLAVRPADALARVVQSPGQEVLMEPTNPLSTVHDIRGLRDEVRLQLHLGGAELRDDYHALESRLHALEQRLRPAMVEGAEDLEAAVHLIADDLHAGFTRLRDALQGRGDA